MLKSISKILARFYHPNSLPEEIQGATGIPLSNFLNYDQIVTKLSQPMAPPSKLLRYMPREEAEQRFDASCKEHSCLKEISKSLSVYTYEFSGRTISFRLQFDDEARLRRVFVDCAGKLDSPQIELPLLKIDSQTKKNADYSGKIS